MKRRFGDRKDGKKIRDIDGFHKIMIDIKSERCDADVYINQKFDVTNLFKYIDQKKKEDPENKITLNNEKDSYKEGEIVGICEVFVGDKKVGEVELYCDRDVEKANFFENIKYNLKNLFKEGV